MTRKKSTNYKVVKGNIKKKSYFNILYINIFDLLVDKEKLRIQNSKNKPLKKKEEKNKKIGNYQLNNKIKL